VGDVIAVSTLAWSVYKSCKDAPQHFHEISGEVSRLHIILKEIGEVLADLKEGLKPSREAELRELATGCQDVLTDLEELLSKFRSLGSRSRRTFDRLRWSQDDVTALRNRIMFNITLLGTFCDTVQMCILPVCEGILLTYNRSSQARLEQKLDEIRKEFRSGLRTDSIVSSASLGEKEAWRQLRRELREAGIPKHVIKEKRALIVSWFQEAMASGDFDGSDTETLRPASSHTEVPKNTSTGRTSDSSDNSPKPRKRSKKKKARTQSTVVQSDIERTNDSRRTDLEKNSRRTSNEQTKATLRLDTPSDNGMQEDLISMTSHIVPATSSETHTLQPIQVSISPSRSSPKPPETPQKHTPIPIETFSPAAEPPSHSPLPLPPQPTVITHTHRHTVEMGNVDKAKTTVQSKVDLNSHRHDELTPLMVTAEERDIKMVLLLLDSGANILDITKDEWTALQYAAEYGGAVLLDRGADCRARVGGWTALHHAACGGQKDAAQLLLDRGVDIEMATKKGWTALHHAAREGKKEVVQLLLGRGADIEATTDDRWTALYLAAHNGEKEVVQLLLDRGADIEMATKKGRTALHRAACEGKKEVVQLLLDRGANIEATTDDRWTALHLAARNGEKEVVQLLLDRGANIKVVGDPEYGWTALHHAARKGKKEVVQLLLDRGADIEATMEDRWTALHLAVHNGEKEVVQLLLDRGADIEAVTSSDGDTALHKAAQFGKKEVAQLLLDRGADIEAVNSTYRWTALHEAAHYGEKEVVQLLLDRGADIEAMTTNGWTALHHAALCGGKEVVQLLLDRGADIEAVENDGWTALHHAACNGEKEVVQLLLDRGADIEAVTSSDWDMALHIAAQFGKKEVAQLLLDRGADINAKSAYDETALTLAAWGGSKDVTQLLLDQGADIEATTKGIGYTALHDAVNSGHEEVARLLLEHGSNVARKDKRGRTPLQIARAKDNLALESLLLQFGAIDSPARVVGVRELWRVIKKRVNEKIIPPEVLPPALQPAQAPAPAEPEH